MLKSAHSPSVYWGKIFFLYRESVRIFKVSPWTKVPPLGQVFKIGKRLCKILSFFVVDKGMIKWATPLGRVFKIYNIFPHGFEGFLIL